MARSASQPGIEDGAHARGGASDVDAEQSRGLSLGTGSVLASKYRLEQLLGEGGMGAVWRAHHLQLDLPVAIKLLNAEGDKANLSERLKVEARAVARLTHPAIVRVFDIDATAGGEPFIVMELLEGESLSDLLERGRLSGVVAVQLLLPIAEGLALAHAKGIVHRDLKPHNVFMTRGDRRVQPKLLDFGIAKLTTPALPTGSLTATGVLLGSPDYMSPEQARGQKDVDSRADIWQFCVVLYESISGTTPFEGENYNALIRAIVEDDPAPLPLENGVDQRLRDLVAWGLAKARDDRPATIEQLGRALAQWLLERGVDEDITGAPLRQKWLSPTAHSVHVLHAPPHGTSPHALPVGDTLVSPRLPDRDDAGPSLAAVDPALRPRPRGGRRLPTTIALTLLAMGVIGTAIRLSGPRALELRSAPRGSVPATALPSTTPVIALAATAPQPSIAASPRSSDSSVSHSASPARSAKPSHVKPAGSAVPPATGARTTRDGHDETRELLQAY